jgi:DNA-binding transcriptional LysR family regulator
MPTLRALECLVAVLDAGSVTEAARELHLSQPALSHQLAGLERELGTPLLERLPRGVRPTAAGRAVAADARLALAAADRVVATARDVAGGRGGRLRLACAESMTAGLLAPVLRGWRRRHRDVAVELTETTSADDLAAALAGGAADVAIGPRPSSHEAAREVVVGTEEILAVVPPDHTPPQTWADLAVGPVVGYHPDNGLAAFLDATAAQRGAALTPVTRTRHAATAAQLAHAGLGVALVPTTGLGAAFPGELRRLDPPLTREVVALVATPHDPMVRAFVGEVVRRGVPVPAAVTRRLAGQS